MNVRNVVVLGECGVGKSSIINMISGAQTTKTSNNVLGEGLKVACYVVVMESGLRVNFWEMKGFPGDVGTVPTRLLRDLKTIVRRLLVLRNVDLLIFCMRAGSITNAVVQGYQAIYVDVCARKVPIALVVNGLEGSSGSDMHGWWAKNKDGIFNRGLAFDIHACVTTLSFDEDPSVGKQIETSQRRLRELVNLPDYFGLPNDRVCPGSESSQISPISPREIGRPREPIQPASPDKVTAGLTSACLHLHLHVTSLTFRIERVGEFKFETSTIRRFHLVL
ncbi:hypothetical protein F5141DRAFT_601738 [Pisolithus sp. B1]|nr:hypothetical protein F5141DRAFT_601738 [Pisolithus sp. B1]